MDLALVYLARGVDGGLSAVEAFFDANRAYPPGCPHELVVIAKGWAGIAGRDDLTRLAHANSARLIDLPDDGFDWGAYMRLAPLLLNTWVCFLNTHSRPCADGWLNLLKIAIKDAGQNIGVVGATASWESLAPLLPPQSSNARFQHPMLYPLRLIRNTTRFLINIWAFPTFPNPHLRSNAFIVRRQLFADFAETQKIPRKKRDAAKLESGRTGFPAYLAQHGLKALVIGRDGNCYGSDRWINSRTFRVPGQPNLLVADNQTVTYDQANSTWRKILEVSAWGKAVS